MSPNDSIPHDAPAPLSVLNGHDPEHAAAFLAENARAIEAINKGESDAIGSRVTQGPAPEDEDEERVGTDDDESESTFDEERERVKRILFDGSGMDLLMAAAKLAYEGSRDVSVMALDIPPQLKGALLCLAAVGEAIEEGRVAVDFGAIASRIGEDETDNDVGNCEGLAVETKDRKRLEVWISNRLNSEQSDAAPLAFFKLSHLVEGALKKPTILEVPARDATSPAAIAQQLCDHLQADANTAGGLQKYEVKAHYGTTETESRGGRFTLRVRGEAEDEADEFGLSGIEVSGRGFASQQMKHNEQLVRINAGMIGSLAESMQGIMSGMARQLETSNDRLSSAYDLLNRHANERMERELAFRQELRKEKREDMAIKAVTNVLMPKLIQEFGANDTRMMKLFESLTPSQMEKILDTLGPEQIPMLAAVIEDAQRKESAEKKVESERERDLAHALKSAEGAGSDKTLDDILVREKDEKP